MPFKGAPFLELNGFVLAVRAAYEAEVQIDAR